MTIEESNLGRSDFDDHGSGELTPAEIAEFEASMEARKRAIAALVPTSEVKVTISPVENDPAILAKAAIDMPYPISMGFSGVIIRRWSQEEQATLTYGAPAVCVDFGKGSTAADERVERALVPRVLRAWDDYENERRRARLRVIK
jgi:hypothetical protein